MEALKCLCKAFMTLFILPYKKGYSEYFFIARFVMIFALGFVAIIGRVYLYTRKGESAEKFFNEIMSNGMLAYCLFCLIP